MKQFIRNYRAPLFFIATVVAGAVLVIQQLADNEMRHIRMREDLILLQQQNQTKHAEWYYQRLVGQLDRLSDRTLLDDYQRTVLLVDPDTKQLDNLVWKFHWAVKNNLDRRAQERVKHLTAPQPE